MNLNLMSCWMVSVSRLRLDLDSFTASPSLSHSGVSETRAMPQPSEHSLSPMHDALLSALLDPQWREVIGDARWRSKLPQPKLSDRAHDLTNIGGHRRHEIIVLYQNTTVASAQSLKQETPRAPRVTRLSARSSRTHTACTSSERQ